MSPDLNARPRAPESDEAFMARFRRAWGEPYVTTAQAAAFDARLRAGITQRARPVRLWSFALLAGAAAAVGMALFVAKQAPQSRAGEWIDTLAEAAVDAGVLDTSMLPTTATAQPQAWWHAVITTTSTDGVPQVMSHEYVALAAWVLSTEETEDTAVSSENVPSEQKESSHETR